MRLLAVALLVAVAPGASAVALLESTPGRALVQVEGNATLHGAGEARVAASGAPLGPWRPAEGQPLGLGACERGLCGLVVVEVRGAEAVVVEGTSGVLVRPAERVEPAAAPFVPTPETGKQTPATAWAALVALLVAARWR